MCPSCVVFERLLMGQFGPNFTVLWCCDHVWLRATRALGLYINISKQSIITAAFCQK